MYRRIILISAEGYILLDKVYYIVEKKKKTEKEDKDNKKQFINGSIYNKRTHVVVKFD